MTKKRLLALLLSFLLFAGLLAGGVAAFNRKPALYYPMISAEDRKSYRIFEDRFELVLSMDLFPNGNCGAGKGDFVALKLDGAESEALAEKLTEQGARVLFYGYSGLYYKGQYYTLENGELKNRLIIEETAKDFAESLYAQRDLSAATALFGAAGAALLLFLAIVLIPAFRKRGDEALAERGPRMPRGKYVASLILAILLTLGTLAWLIAPNLYMAFENRFEAGVLAASLLSIPFLLIGVLNLFNLTRFRRYRRWLNILCVVVTAILYGFLLFGLVMMLLTP